MYDFNPLREDFNISYVMTVDKVETVQMNLTLGQNRMIGKEFLVDFEEIYIENVFKITPQQYNSATVRDYVHGITYTFRDNKTVQIGVKLSSENNSITFVTRNRSQYLDFRATVFSHKHTM